MEKDVYADVTQALNWITDVTGIKTSSSSTSTTISTTTLTTTTTSTTTTSTTTTTTIYDYYSYDPTTAGRGLMLAPVYPGLPTNCNDKNWRDTVSYLNF